MAEDTQEDPVVQRFSKERFNLSPALVSALEIGRSELNNRPDAYLPEFDAATFNQFLLTNIAVVLNPHVHTVGATEIPALLERARQPDYPASTAKRGVSTSMSIEIRLPEETVRAVRSSGLDNEAALLGGLILLDWYLKGKPLRLQYDDGGQREYPFVDHRGERISRSG